jgi:hypothetical protein
MPIRATTGLGLKPLRDAIRAILIIAPASRTEDRQASKQNAPNMPQNSTAFRREN